jgi:anti-anti-sigma regulatory factor
VVFGAGDLSDYKLLKKKVKKKLGKLQKRGGSKARLRIDGVGLDLDGKLRARQLKRLAKDLRGMKGSFTVAGIPEPGTLMLLASGLAGLGLVNRHLSRRD